MDMDDELERELAQQMEEDEEDICLQMAIEQDAIHRPLAKVLSLPANFTFSGDSPLSTSPNSKFTIKIIIEFQWFVIKIFSSMLPNQ